MWISPAFSLKVIRTFDALHNSSPEETTSDKIKSGVILLESAAKTLNLSNSSKLGAYQKLSKVAGLPELMPIYAIDAPADAPDGSSRPTLSLSALLKQYGIRLTANQAYHQMAKLGIVEQRERYSRTAINNIKILVADRERLHVRQEHHQSCKSARDAAAFLRIPIP